MNKQRTENLIINKNFLNQKYTIKNDKTPQLVYSSRAGPLILVCCDNTWL